jgi:hypothetical protein
METTPFFVFLFIHLSFLVLGFGSVLVTDLYGLLWIWDRVRFTHLVRVSAITKKFIWAGWLGMVASGIPLILHKGEVDNLMVIKLFFVAVVGLNGILLHSLHKKVEGYSKGKNVPNAFMFQLMLSLFISQLAWWGALIIGFLHRHVQSVIEWPPHPWPWLIPICILTVLVLLWYGGTAVFKK